MTPKEFKSKVFQAIDKIYSTFPTETLKYIQVRPGVYDVTSGTVSDNERTLNIKFMVSGIVGEQDTLADIHTGDLLLTCKGKGLSITPNLNDKVVRKGVEYTIVSVVVDSIVSEYKLHVRK